MNNSYKFPSISGRSIGIVALGIAMIFGFLFFVSKPNVEAHEDPTNCNASGLQQTPSIAPSGSVHDGDTITYSVTYSNTDINASGTSPDPCNVTGANATITLPDGSVINVLTNATLTVGTTISCPGGPGCAAGPYTYVVDHSDEVGTSVTAVFDIAGILHQDADEEVASDHDTLSKTVIHPSTVTSISSSAPSVNVGGTVNLTVTEQNNGDVALTSPSVVVDNGVGTLSAPPTSGDTGNDGILGVGETWSWTVSNVVINADTTFTATGHGTDSTSKDITWCANIESPPQGVRCDQEERDTVTVTVIVQPLVVTKTSRTAHQRSWNWTINKSADQTDLLLAENEQFTVNYTVSVSAVETSVIDMSGTITVSNPAGNPSATVTGVTDTFSIEGAATVSCPVTFPHVLAGGASFICTYQDSPATATNQNNTATATTSGSVPGDSDTVPVTFGPATLIDECITVDDTYAEGPQSVVVCHDDPPAEKTFTYAVTFGPDGGQGVDVVVDCGEQDHENTASFLAVDDANDTAETGSDTVTLPIEVACVDGCTLTQGYWKTHNASFKGGAPVDVGWENLGALKESTLFFTTGKTWFAIFWTAPKGNVYYNLAHQYMAAKLNILNGASTTPAVDSAITQAENLFNTTSIAQAGALKGQAKNTWTSLAGTLGSFNEGVIGPGHCDEQNP